MVASRGCWPVKRSGRMTRGGQTQTSTTRRSARDDANGHESNSDPCSFESNGYRCTSEISPMLHSALCLLACDSPRPRCAQSAALNHGSAPHAGAFRATLPSHGPPRGTHRRQQPPAAAYSSARARRLSAPRRRTLAGGRRVSGTAASTHHTTHGHETSAPPSGKTALALCEQGPPRIV